MEQGSWYLILNPQAGGGRGIKHEQEILQAISRRSLTCELYTTRCAGDATDAVQRAIEQGHRKIVVAGGDGTMNEVLNGIMQQNTVPSVSILLAQIPVGTGNDWRRTWNIGGSIQGAISLLENPATTIQDVAKITFQHQGHEKTQWFMNVAGCGFDAQVTLAANQAKSEGKSGLFTYISKLITTLSAYQEPRIRYRIDTKEYNNETFALLAGICKYAGNAMKLVPEADPRDGLFHLTVANKISKFKVIRNLHRLFTGSFIKLKEVKTFTCRELEILTPELQIQADGESIGHSPALFEISPRKLHIVIAR